MPDLAYCADLVRRDDPDRFLTALFAPSGRRDDLFALYAFNVEVARSREAVSEPMLGLIRLQWWRDAIAECYAGRPRRHHVVEPLAAAIDAHGLPRPLFDRLLESRELDFSDRPVETLDELVAYAEASSGGLSQLALSVLAATDGPSQAAGRLVGTAWALTGLMRALPHQLRQGRCLLPREVMARHGADERALAAMKPSDPIRRSVEEVCTIASKKIDESSKNLPGRVGPGLPALLPGTLARGYLARFARLGHDPFDARNARPLSVRSWRLMLRAMAGRY